MGSPATRSLPSPCRAAPPPCRIVRRWNRRKRRTSRTTASMWGTYYVSITIPRSLHTSIHLTLTVTCELFTIIIPILPKRKPSHLSKGSQQTRERPGSIPCHVGGEDGQENTVLCGLDFISLSMKSHGRFSSMEVTFIYLSI